MRTLLAAATATILTCTAGFAATVGQPFLVIEDDISGSILDNFFGGIPSGIQSVTLSGTVTEAIGATALAGADLRISRSELAIQALA